MHRRRTSDRYTVPQAMPHDRSVQFGKHDARAAGLVMNVRLWLTLIVPIHVASAVVGMVVMITVIMLVVMMVMMAMINMPKLSPIMGMNEQTGEGTGRHRCGQTEHRRQRKHGNHRPDQGNVASAQSFQSRQHRLSFFETVSIPSPSRSVAASIALTQADMR